MAFKVKPITVGEVKEIAHVLAQKHLTFSEPIPRFETRSPNILESCLAVPFQSFGGEELYSGLTEKAAMLFYLMIKNHLFQNGNKRIALTTLLVFLAKNDKWLKVDNIEFYNFTRWVAESNSKLKDETVLATQKFLKTYLVNIDQHQLRIR